MEQIQVLEHGHIMLPEAIRQNHNWDIGQELLIVEKSDGVLLKPKPFFKPTKLDELAGCLQYKGSAKTLEEMNEAIAEGVKQYLCD